MEAAKVNGVVFNMTSSDEERLNTPPTSLQAPISPPRLEKSRPNRHNVDESNAPTPASIAAGEIQIQDHLSYFSSHLARAVRSEDPGPRLSIPDFVTLYQRNCHPHGRHFVVHQHDHPIAGVHYDLRLQISETSSISFAIMYGLPGNPNSRRLNRNATETRVHCLWVRFFFLVYYPFILFLHIALLSQITSARHVVPALDFYNGKSSNKLSWATSTNAP